ncbi:hypothetical protein GCM10028861_00470 [Flavobacterium koreense]
MHIFIFDYHSGKVYKSKLKKKHIAKPENYIIKQGFNLDNVHYMTTNESEIINI